MWGGFSVSKLKPQLKMAVSRIQIASNKKAALLKQNMREIAVMLDEDPPKEEKAKIRAEALIRDDCLIEAYEILQLECELLHERIKLIEYSKTCPEDLVPVVATIMWASQRVDVPELLLIRKQFKSKYGKNFEEAAMRNTGGILNERVVSKLSVEPPAAYLVQTYLEKICTQFQVDWKPSVPLTASQMAEPVVAPVGYSVPVAQGTGLGEAVATPYNSTPSQEERDAALKQNGGIPPPVITATAVTPVPPPAPGSTVGGGSASAGGGVSVAGGGGASTAAASSMTDADFGEPDIFIPAPPPTAPPGSKGDGGKPKDDDGDDDGIPPAAPRGGAGDVTSSYSDLAARFDSLKR